MDEVISTRQEETMDIWVYYLLNYRGLDEAQASMNKRNSKGSLLVGT